ncbi:MAG: hypothetical protein II644_04430 [Paludibacteraceae bacterium]|nr:hypothetical protein [Paludibacteraceae bacterium]
MKKRFLISLFAIVGLLLAANVNAQNSREYIRNAIRNWGECKNVAITKYNGDVALYGRNGWAGTGMPDGLSNALTELHDDGELIDDVQISESGKWLVLYGDNGVRWRGIPYSLEKKIREFHDRGDVITSITFEDNGKWILISKEYYVASHSWIQDWLSEGADSYGALWAACVTSDAMVAVYESGYKFWGEVPSALKQALRETSMDVYRVKIAGSAWFYSDGEGDYNYSM